MGFRGRKVTAPLKQQYGLFPCLSSGCFRGRKVTAPLKQHRQGVAANLPCLFPWP